MKIYHFLVIKVPYRPFTFSDKASVSYLFSIVLLCIIIKTEIHVISVNIYFH